jgi:hypothetical protein
MDTRPIYLGLIVVAFFASLTTYFLRETKRYLRFFPLFLMLTVITETIAIYGLVRPSQITIIYNFFATIEILFYLYVLQAIIQNQQVRKIILGGSLLYLVLAIVNLLFIQQITSFKSIPYAIGCLMIVSICIYYFYELFRLPHFVNLLGQPEFWICSGLLFFYSCSFPIFSLMNVIQKLPAFILQNLRFIVFFLNVFLYSSFTIAFLCRLRTRNSTS